jgi:hypothetical protein
MGVPDEQSNSVRLSMIWLESIWVCVREHDNEQVFVQRS